MLHRGLRAMIAGMGFAGMLLACIGSDASAAQRPHQRLCAGTLSLRCAHADLTAASKRGSRPVRRSKLFRGDESSIGQLPGHLRSTSALSLDRSCGAGFRPNCRPRPDLPDILLSAPSPQTTGALGAYGIPAIPDAPPIVLLNPQDRKDRDDPFPLTLPGGGR